ncbi:DNA/RNA non-specific endonuclease [Acinetobacter sichuanensis]|uniref:Endonuclease n=1 Tax=Acinetobacter sichuanensis TaxID=2136183 RepID=A0A371YT24_9GAMM|nr:MULTISPECIES: DNA/RNA non-specific endonuclease [Acinetobacter]MDM1246177.1 DNA/RNA non-specific endonuclease [Acinetobacter sp. R933-2]RFC84619.1 DNA/RNA non-specific endonuclease [Acinetobacter sichuanensis]
MARKKRRSKTRNLGKDLLNNSVVKVILGLVATGSFAIAFGQEKIAQYIPFVGSNSTECLKQFYRDEPPFLVKESLQKNSYPLCFNGFNVMYSGVSKTPLWTAEHLSPERLSQKIKREDSFHEETRVSLSHRALLSDYKGSGYDRGHMSPNADMPDKASQHDSFSLANMVPQAPKNNQQIWRELEEATRAIVTKQKKDVYVVTGPVFSGKKLKTIGKGVIVPSAVFKAIYIPKQGVIGAYYAPNDNSLKVNIVSVCYLEEQLGINLFPQLTEEQKRNTYKLPLNSSQVKATGKVEYSHWDAESQCAPSVSADQIKTLQKQFQPANGTSNSQSSSSSTPAQGNVPKIDEQVQESLVKQLVDVLLQYLLQILK